MIEINIDDYKTCNIFKIKGESFGIGIKKFELIQVAMEMPKLILYVSDYKLKENIDKLEKLNLEFQIEKYITGENIITIYNFITL